MARTLNVIMLACHVFQNKCSQFVIAVVRSMAVAVAYSIRMLLLDRSFWRETLEQLILVN
jgi:hypothetical protein